MSVIHPKLAIPDAFQLRIDAGELWRDGGVLRETANGRIALILKDTLASKKDAEPMQLETPKALSKVNIGDFLKNHKGATTVGIIGLVLTVGAGIYLYVDKKKNDKAVDEMSKSLAEFQTALSNYLKLAMGGSLKISDINRLIKALDNLEQGNEGEQIIVDFSQGELNTLVNCIIGYTKALAMANTFELDSSYSNDECTALNLRRHLEMQKSIFENVS